MIKKIFFILLCFLYFGCDGEDNKADRENFMKSAGIHYHVDYRTNICFASNDDYKKRYSRYYNDLFVVVPCTQEVLNLADNKTNEK